MKGKIASLVGAVAVGALMMAPGTAHAAAQTFDIYTTDAKQGGNAWGTLVTGAAWNECSYAKLKDDAESGLWDTAADGRAAVAWLVYTRCSDGVTEKTLLGRAGGSGTVVPLSTAPEYDVRNAKVMVCLTDTLYCRSSR